MDINYFNFLEDKCYNIYKIIYKINAQSAMQNDAYYLVFQTVTQHQNSKHKVTLITILC